MNDSTLSRQRRRRFMSPCHYRMGFGWLFVFVVMTGCTAFSGETTQVPSFGDRSAQERVRLMREWVDEKLRRKEFAERDGIERETHHNPFDLSPR